MKRERHRGAEAQRDEVHTRCEFARGEVWLWRIRGRKARSIEDAPKKAA